MDTFFENINEELFATAGVFLVMALILAVVATSERRRTGYLTSYTVVNLSWIALGLAFVVFMLAIWGPSISA